MLRKLMATSSIVLLGLAPLAANGQEIQKWAAISISTDGATGIAQNAASLTEARSSALASCWNHSRVPRQCIASSGGASQWFAAVRCIHRTPSGMIFTRIATSLGNDTMSARQNAVNAAIKDGNVYARECTVVVAVPGSTETQPQDSPPV